MASLTSLTVAFVLIAVKFWAWLATGSVAMLTSALDALGLAALAITLLTGWPRADPVFALGISVYMLWNARGIAAEALGQLMDRELEGKDRDRIQQAALACTGAKALHDLRTRDAGDRVFIEFYLEVDGGLPVSRGHAIADAAETAAGALFPNGAEVTAHIEPAGIRDERLDDKVHAG